MLFSLRVLTYQPTVRVPNVQALDPSYLSSTLADYAVPFHPSTLATIPTDMQSEWLYRITASTIIFHYVVIANNVIFNLLPIGLDLFSLIQADSQVCVSCFFLQLKAVLNMTSRSSYQFNSGFVEATRNSRRSYRLLVFAQVAFC